MKYFLIDYQRPAKRRGAARVNKYAVSSVRSTRLENTVEQLITEEIEAFEGLSAQEREGVLERMLNFRNGELGSAAHTLITRIYNRFLYVDEELRARRAGRTKASRQTSKTTGCFVS